jgi:antitoxin (DNA-binding transcriptional repressor) of toxin-antitoxin stability system
MKNVKVSEFKAKLARYLRMVAKGEEVVLHSRNLPIASVRRLGAEDRLLVSKATVSFSEALKNLPELHGNKEVIDTLSILVADRRRN